MHKYLVVIDMQNDFVTGALGTQEAKAIIPAVKKRIEGAASAGRTVFFTQDTHHENYMDTSEGSHLPVAHCVEGTDGWKIIPELAPFAHETIRKPTFGAVLLVKLLETVSEDDGKNIDIALCGVCTDICVVSNALLIRAHFPEATIRLYEDSCAGSTPARHNAAIEVMRSCQIEVE